MRTIKVIFTLIALTTAFGFTTNNITSDIECKILHEGTFKYGNDDNEVKVVIKGKNHTEYHNGGKYIIKSELKWVNDCEYNMTIKKVTIPNFPFAKGDVMNVKINDVKGKEISFTSTVNGHSWTGKLTKIE